MDDLIAITDDRRVLRSTEDADLTVVEDDVKKADKALNDLWGTWDSFQGLMKKLKEKFESEKSS